MLNRTILLSFFLFSNFLFSQSNPKNTKELGKKYESFFKTQSDYLYLHLNKTSFFVNETLWFAAYAYNIQVQKPNKEITNLEVSIYDENHKFISHKTLYINDGKSWGDFKLDEKEFEPGMYYIAAYTEYMKNFDEKPSFIQSFTILGKDKKELGKDNPEDYAIHILPEGGHLVANIKNTMGVKVNNQKGQGIPFTKAILYNSKQDTLQEFSSNKWGFSKFEFTPKFKENYYVDFVTPKGDTIKHQIQPAEEIGVNLKLLSFNKEKTVIEVKGNQKTLPSLLQKKYYLSIHRNGVMKTLDFEFVRGFLGTKLELNTNEFFEGINIVTVFNEDFHPLLERLVYNPHKTKEVKLQAKLIKNHGDSLEIGLESYTNHLKKLSISVLPKQTNAYNSTKNVLSSVLLKPYIKGFMEKENQYFDLEESLEKRMENLDLLLLTQGWSKYNWYKIFSNSKKEIFPRNTGFELVGTVLDRNKKREDEVFLTTKCSNLFETLVIDDSNQFKMDSLYLIKDDAISIGVINKRNKKISIPKISLSIYPPFTPQTINTYFKTNSTYMNEVHYNLINHKNSVFTKNPKNFLNTNELEAVMLIGKARKDSYERIDNFTEKININENLPGSFKYATDLIRNEGFTVEINQESVKVFSNRYYTMTQGVGNKYYQITTQVYIDGVIVQPNGYTLRRLETVDLESVQFNKLGAGEGLFGGGGVIRIITKKDSRFKHNIIKKTIKTLQAQNGFSPAKEFFNPEYSNLQSDYFLYYGTIHWEPNLVMKNAKTFKIVNTLTPNLSLYVEGVSETGELISQTIHLPTK
ncbi:hypothetical protein ACFQ3R_07730 [Mesonia ostreae]|uniref:TonB-dependent receptor plug domain-containing protein n=1 Tax=Mesonia ostreae TaxID=861110 RepID=A0ABU2KMA3_9FLAO|nr:hypothetical protein [Mesonia ostreae]MDT0295799.1 hypothetical protein [Mesonia ostreae]